MVSSLIVDFRVIFILSIFYLVILGEIVLKVDKEKCFIFL